MKSLRNDDVPPLFVTAKVTKTTLAFFPLARHPKAVRFERRKWLEDQEAGELTDQGIVRLTVVEQLWEEGADLFEALSKYEQVSLPALARFWPVPKTRLEAAEGTKGDLFDECDRGDADDPGSVLIHKSGWDHSVWGIDGEQILMPLELSIWGTQYDLKAVEAHLKKHPAFVSFDIVRNGCRQNYEISGAHLGELVVDPRKFDRALLPEVVTRSWVENEVVRGYSGSQHDLLGLAAFRRER